MNFKIFVCIIVALSLERCESLSFLLDDSNIYKTKGDPEALLKLYNNIFAIVSKSAKDTGKLAQEAGKIAIESGKFAELVSTVKGNKNYESHDVAKDAGKLCEEASKVAMNAGRLARKTTQLLNNMEKHILADKSSPKSERQMFQNVSPISAEEFAYYAGKIAKFIGKLVTKSGIMAEVAAGRAEIFQKHNLDYNHVSSMRFQETPKEQQIQETDFIHAVDGEVDKIQSEVNETISSLELITLHVNSIITYINGASKLSKYRTQVGGCVDADTLRAGDSVDATQIREICRDDVIQNLNQLLNEASDKNILTNQELQELARHIAINNTSVMEYLQELVSHRSNDQLVVDADNTIALDQKNNGDKKDVNINNISVESNLDHQNFQNVNLSIGKNDISETDEEFHKNNQEASVDKEIAYDKTLTSTGSLKHELVNQTGLMPSENIEVSERAPVSCAADNGAMKEAIHGAAASIITNTDIDEKMAKHKKLNISSEMSNLQDSITDSLDKKIDCLPENMEQMEEDKLTNKGGIENTPAVDKKLEQHVPENTTINSFNTMDSNVLESLDENAVQKTHLPKVMKLSGCNSSDITISVANQPSARKKQVLNEISEQSRITPTTEVLSDTPTRTGRYWQDTIRSDDLLSVKKEKDLNQGHLQSKTTPSTKFRVLADATTDEVTLGGFGQGQTKSGDQLGTMTEQDFNNYVENLVAPEKEKIEDQEKKEIHSHHENSAGKSSDNKTTDQLIASSLKSEESTSEFISEEEKLNMIRLIAKSSRYLEHLLDILDVEETEQNTAEVPVPRPRGRYSSSEVNPKFLNKNHKRKVRRHNKKDSPHTLYKKGKPYYFAESVGLQKRSVKKHKK